MASINRNRRIVGVNLKMEKDLGQTNDYITAIVKATDLINKANIEIFIMPDFVSLSTAESRLEKTNILLGAQNCYSEDKGAFTGEVSPVVLHQAGVKIVQIGHAERRRLFHETDAEIAKKAAAIVRNGMTPLLCCGEQKQSAIASQAVGQAISECRTQIEAVLAAIPDNVDLFIAYEPVWAIGASQPASSDHVNNVVQNIRQLVAKREGGTRILYGGAAGAGTFQAIEESVDGLFLGRSAHDVQNLMKVIEELGQ